MASKTDGTTHADGCYRWGPRHYDCAAREIERLERELAGARAMVPDGIVAGALYDLMGYLTSRPQRLTLSATDLAAPAVDALVGWATLRGLNLSDARIKGWNEHLSNLLLDHVGKGDPRDVEAILPAERASAESP